jgi:hypothetical protein
LIGKSLDHPLAITYQVANPRIELHQIWFQPHHTPSESTMPDPTTRRRSSLLDGANATLGHSVAADWDWRQGSIGPIDVVAFAGGDRFCGRLRSDFFKDRAGYRKIGGVSNSPDNPYFYRRYANIVHLMRRAGTLYMRGGSVRPAAGMVLVLDWPETRGRFNFSPDRVGIILATEDDRITRAAVPIRSPDGWMVGQARFAAGSPSERAVIGYGDLPD